jgi:hypothetical protein
MARRFTPAARRAAAEARTAGAVARAADLASIIGELHASGITTLSGIAVALNDRGVATPWGRHHWGASQVRRLLKRLPGEVGWKDPQRDSERSARNQAGNTGTPRGLP